MSKLSLAYIFQQQQLLVDQHFQLPRVEALASDLLLHARDHGIARYLLLDEPIPADLQLVPVRQLLQFWNTQRFEQASRAVHLFEWRPNLKCCSHRATAPEAHAVEYAMDCPCCNYRQS